MRTVLERVSQEDVHLCVKVQYCSLTQEKRANLCGWSDRRRQNARIRRPRSRPVARRRIGRRPLNPPAGESHGRVRFGVCRLRLFANLTAVPFDLRPVRFGELPMRIRRCLIDIAGVACTSGQPPCPTRITCGLPRVPHHHQGTYAESHALSCRGPGPGPRVGAHRSRGTAQ